MFAITRGPAPLPAGRTRAAHTLHGRIHRREVAGEEFYKGASHAATTRRTGARGDFGLDRHKARGYTRLSRANGVLCVAISCSLPSMCVSLGFPLLRGMTCSRAVMLACSLTAEFGIHEWSNPPLPSFVSLRTCPHRPPPACVFLAEPRKRSQCSRALSGRGGEQECVTLATDDLLRPKLHLRLSQCS